MILSNIDNVKDKDRLLCQCDICGKNFERTLKNIKRSKKRNGSNQELCNSCICKLTIKPQQTKEYWTNEKKKAHGELIKNNENYKIGRAAVHLVKEKNGMYGKKHSIFTKNKMSNSRFGKIGENATAWKGGKASLTRRVKKVIHTRFNWYKRIYERDNYQCVYCGNKLNLEAHHIIPIVTIIKKLLLEVDKKLIEDEILEWLVLQDEIIDKDLHNGITLCRDCHKTVHNKWGSHSNP